MSRYSSSSGAGMEWSDIGGSIIAAVLTAALISGGANLVRRIRKRRIVGRVLLRLAYPDEEVEAKLRYTLGQKIDLRYDNHPKLVADRLRHVLQTEPDKDIVAAISQGEGLSDAVSDAVRQTRPARPASQWRRLVGSRWTAASAAALVGGLAWAATRTKQPDDALILKIGQCFDPGPDWPSNPAVTVVDCASPHRYQFYATAEYPNPTEPYPGQARLAAFASSFCRGPAFTVFTGQSLRDSDLTSQSVRPATSTTWTEGERRVGCYLALRDNNEVSLSGSRQYSSQALAASATTNRLKTGQCFNPGPDWPSNPAVTVVDCASPHRYQFYATAEYPNPTEPYPGQARLAAFASSFCRGPAFTAFTGETVKTSQFGITRRTFPIAKAWAAGGRRVNCSLAPPGGVTWTGSAQYITRQQHRGLLRSLTS